MKKDKLYTVGGNIQAKKLYPDGGFLPMPQNYSWGNGLTLPSFQVAQGQPLSNETIGKANDYYTKQINTGNNSAFNTAAGIAGSLAPMATPLISGGYSTGGVGEGISAAGNAIGSAIPGPWGTVVKVGTSILGGLVNRGWGVKENKKNTAAIKENTALAKSVGNELGSASTNSEVLNAASNMTGSLGFKASDLYKNGWFTKKGTKKGNALNNQEAGALAYQNHGLVTGASNADYNMDSNIMRNFAAFGGPLDYLGNNNMGAIEYGFMSDYLTNKKKQAENKGTANLFAGMPASMFGEGGSIEIKHPGRLTELKKRTGKTEAELWAEGNPGVRKMITFARNARKWSKALGGKIERDGVSIPDNVFCGGGKMFHGGGCLPNLFELGGPDDDYVWSPVDTRSDTTRQGYHEGNMSYGADYQGPLGVAKQVLDTYAKDHNPNLITGVAPTPYLKGKPNMAYAESYMKKHGLKSFSAANGKRYVKTPDGKVKSLESIAREEEARVSQGAVEELRRNAEAAKAAGINIDKPYHSAPLRDPAVNLNATRGSINRGKSGKVSNRNAQSANDIDLFALGGDIQSNGADFTTGMSYINAGGSHEENPNQGVQVGVDQEGTPNLVEEGETIFNDYVYSNRITADEETKKKFHIGKKREITFADLSKKLEKEAAERPNDPISQAALQAQMADLADEQERQKQEMEAAKAQAAFESLTPEEKVGVMQYAQQQDQMAQEQAMQEQMMAQQYAQEQQPMSLEEAAMMQQQQQQMPMQGQPILGAYGGLMNRFDLGGFAWIKKHHPEVKNPQQVAAALEKMMQSNRDSYYYGDVSMFGGASSPQWHFQQAWNSMMPATTGVGAAKRHIQRWIDAGLDRDIAFNLVLPESKADSVGGGKEGRDAFIAARNAAYKELVTDANKAQKASVSKPVYGTSKSGLHTKTIDGVTQYRGADGNYYYNENRALATRNQATPKEEKKEEEVAAPKQEAAAVKPAEVKSNADNSRSRAQAAPKAAGSGNPKVSNNTDDGINVGTYRQEGNQWNTYGLPGLQQYLLGAAADYSLAETDEAKREVAQKIVDQINGLQQSYKDYIAPTLGQQKQKKDINVGNHQALYHDYTGNAGFRRIENGQEVDLTDEAVIKPEGHSTTDNLAGKFRDDLSGPQTWLRYFGATGDKLDDIVGALREMRIDYSPYADWTIGKGNNARQLYRASLINSPSTGGATPNNSVGNTPRRIFHAVDGVGDGEYLEGDPSTWNGVGAEVRRETLPNGDTVIYHAPLNGNTNNNSIGVVNTDNGYDVEPIHRNEKWRYAGLFGPAVGLGMQALGIGKPDTKALDGILEGYDRRGASYADYRPIGNYITYRPMDIWSEQNRLNASSRATDRAIMNSTSPSRMAGLLASGYNDQLASGQLYRQALEYNDANALKKGEFNRGTDMFNAQAYNQTAQFNASQRERDRQLKAQLGMQVAAHKADMDAAWYNGIYGNVAGLFKGIGDLGRENAQHNMIADMAATGIFGTIKDQPIANGYVRVVPKKNTTAKGGKVNRKKGKRGLTF